MDEFVRAGFIALWCIFSFSIHGAEVHERWPLAVTKGHQAIVKVVNDEHTSTGFVVKNNSGEVFVTVSSHAIYNLIEEPKALSSLQLIDRKGRVLPFQGLEAFAISPDLALVKLTDYKGPSLQLDHFDEESQEGFVLGFPDGDFKQMKIWNLRSSGKINLDGITYFREVPGSSGSPLFNSKGFVIGVLVRAGIQYSVFFSRSSALKKLLTRTEKHFPKDILKSQKSQLKEQLNSLEALAERGDVEAQSRLGQLYKEKGFLFYNPEKSRKWMGRAAKNGDPLSQMSMAEFYMEHGAYAKGWRLMKRAAQQRFPQAMYYISEFYRLGIYGFPKDSQKALIWLIRTMETNHPEAINRMAKMSLTGVDVPQNVSFGLRLFQLLSERDYSSLQEILSELGISFSESAFWSELMESNEGPLPEILQDFPGIRACVPSLFRESEIGAD
ncbi:MAG: bifunctional trypsin-like peptidase domain-containing/SEL1-like repeat protein [Bdellovibrionales bacterium]|nr:bifunctional trypsin-like peptidase domain-containing/SEL1-like repeat protein [Bdellovibrionales bacterium]